MPGEQVETVVEFREVTKRYGRRGSAAALSAVSFSVPTGAVWAVVGPNGAGKSTLLSLLLGFIRPTGGTIDIAGDAPRDYLRDHGAGYLPERFRLPASWRVRDALQLCTRLDGNFNVNAVGDAASRWGLEAHADKRLDQLSRGLLQRLGLAQALLAERPLVVLDEPTEGLDPIWRIRLRDEVAALREAGTTVILASHDLGEVERVADRAVLLDRGAIREIMDIRTDTTSAAFDITVRQPFDLFDAAFPAAQPLEPGVYRVHVGGAVELSERLAALLALGAVVSAVEPARMPLEDRVRAALEHDS